MIENGVVRIVEYIEAMTTCLVVWAEALHKLHDMVALCLCALHVLADISMK